MAGSSGDIGLDDLLNSRYGLVINPIIGAKTGGLTPTIQVTSKLPVTCTYDATLLPPEYQEVEYIESTGTQYIDTGVTSYNWEIEFEALEFTQKWATSESRSLAASHSLSSSSNYQRNMFALESDDKLFTMRGAVNNYSTRTVEYGRTYKLYAKINSTLGRVVVDDELWTESTASVSVVPDNTILLYSTPYAVRNQGIASPPSKTRKRIRMWVDGVLTRDYIPCYRKSDTSIGLYDLVENKFYENKGTSPFLKGADVYHTDRPITPKIFNIPNPEWRGLPEGYTQVSYIESHGTENINTHYKFTSQNTVVSTRWRCTDTGALSMMPFGGGVSNWNVNPIPLIYLYGTGVGSYKVQIYAGSKNTAGVGTTAEVVHDYRLETENQTSKLYIDGVLADTLTFTGTVDNSSDLYVFGTYFGGSTEYRYGKGISWGFEAYDNNVLARDLVPCFNSNNEYGMYDMVSHTFFGNSGTGSFTGGEEVPQYLGTYYVYDNLALGEYEVNDGIKSAMVTLSKTERIKVVFSADIPRSGLVAEYLFDGNMTDSSGSGNNGTLNGATFTSGIVSGQAITKSGSTTAPQIPNALVDNLYSYSMWFTLPENTLDLAVLTDLFKSSSLMMTTDLPKDGQYLRFNGVDIVPYIPNEKHHLVIVNRTSTYSAIYVDGVLVNNSIDHRYSGTQNYNYLLGITTNRSWAGKMDNLRIYNRVLTQDEITELYYEGVSI